MTAMLASQQEREERRKRADADALARVKQAHATCKAADTPSGAASLLKAACKELKPLDIVRVFEAERVNLQEQAALAAADARASQAQLARAKVCGEAWVVERRAGESTCACELNCVALMLTHICLPFTPAIHRRRCMRPGCLVTSLTSWRGKRAQRLVLQQPQRSGLRSCMRRPRRCGRSWQHAPPRHVVGRALACSSMRARQVANCPFLANLPLQQAQLESLQRQIAIMDRAAKTAAAKAAAAEAAEARRCDLQPCAASW